MRNIFCEIILNLGQWFKEMSFIDISYPELWRPSCSVEQTHLCNFGRGHLEKHFYKITLNLDQWFRRCCDISYLELW